jgi:hypothetical protein
MSENTAVKSNAGELTVVPPRQANGGAVVHRTASMVELESGEMDVLTAVAEFQSAVAGMRPDDVNFEYSRDDRGAVKMRFRAYRHNR